MLPCSLSPLQVSQQNRARLAALPPRQKAPPPRPGAEVRERALRFAQSGVPKPSSFRGRDDAGLQDAATAALAQHATQGGDGEAAGAAPAEEAAANAQGAQETAAPEEVAGELQALQLEMAITGADDVPHASRSPEPVLGC